MYQVYKIKYSLETSFYWNIRTDQISIKNIDFKFGIICRHNWNKNNNVFKLIYENSVENLIIIQNLFLIKLVIIEIQKVL